MRVSELITRLQTYYSPDEQVCAPIWQAGDVQQVADDMEISTPLSGSQIAGVLNSMERNHDACIGITWETIQCAIQVEIS